MSLLMDIWGWVPWLAGGGVLGAGALVIAAKFLGLAPVLSIVAEFLAPFARGAGQLAVYFIKAMWELFTLCLAKPIRFGCIAIIAVTVASLYGHVLSPRAVATQKEVIELRKAKAPVKKKIADQGPDSGSFWADLDWLLGGGGK